LTFVYCFFLFKVRFQAVHSERYILTRWIQIFIDCIISRPWDNCT